MITEKGKKELTQLDYDVLSEILTKSPGVLTPEDRAHLVARRGYLTEETLKEYGIKGGEKKIENGGDSAKTDDDPADDQNDDAADYSGLKKPELIAECEKREIEIPARTTVGNLIEILEADDRGELEDDEDEK